MIRILTIAAMLIAAACNQPASDGSPANETAGNAPPASATAEFVPVLEGQWGVASIDGKPVADAMVASFANGKASLSSGCLRRAWTYSQKRNMVTFTADPTGSANCGGGTTGEQETAYAALEQASIAIFNKDGSEANLSGTGGNLTLRRR